MTKTNAVITIERLYFKLEGILSSSRNSERLYKLCEQEERDHRRFKPYGVKFGISIRTAAQLFYVRNVLCYLAGERQPPRAQDYWALKGSVFGGFALYAESAGRIVGAFSEAEVKEAMAFDYSELVA